MIKYGFNNKTLTLEKINEFLFFIGKLDINCNDKYILKWRKKGIILKYFVNLVNFTIEETNIDFQEDDYYLEISDDPYFTNKNYLYILNEDSKYNICFNYLIEDEEVINNIIKSYYVFEKSFIENNYKFIEDEMKFINSFNYIKNLNTENLTITQIFTKQLKNNKDKIAIKYKNLSFTYYELYDKILKLSKLICSYTKVGDSVSILLNKSENLVITIWAILFSGNNYVPIDIKDPQDRINFIIKNSNSKLLIYDDESFDCHIINKILINDINFNDLEKNTSKLDNSIDLAYILHTSGTTGEPKGVKIRKEGVINYSLYQIETLGWSNKDIIVQKTPYIWDVSLRELIVPFLCGATVVITENEKHKDPEYILNLIKKEKLTFVHFVPSMLNIFLEFVTNENDLSSVKNVVCSGEALPDPLRIKFYKYFKNATLYNMYGPTEATVEVTNYTCPKDDIDMKMHIGKTIPNTPLLILNKDGKILPQGIIGELHIGGVQVSSGYVNQDELTKKTFVENNYVNSKLYKTGDLAKLLNTNNIEYLGRIDSQIKIRGMRIEVSEIKKNILKENNIIDCHVTLYNFNGTDFLIAYISPTTINENEIIKSISKFLPKQMIPDRIIKLDKFPISKNGKLEKSKLPIPNFLNNKEINIKEDKLKDIIKNFFINESLDELKANNLIELILSNEKNIDIKFLKTFSDLLNIQVSNLNIDSELEFIGIDSLKMMILQSNLKKQNYNIPIDDLVKFKTICGIYNNIKEYEVKNNYSVDYYFEKIKNITNKNDKVLCIHSSLYQLNLDIDNLTTLVIKLINYWTSNNLTILIPAFTFSFTETAIYDTNSKSEVGILADIVLENFKDSKRTCHPIYSFVVLGPLQKKFFNFSVESCFGKNSIFEILENYNTRLITLNTDNLTIIHRYEEINNIDYRFYKDFKGIIKNNDLTYDVKTIFYCRYLDDRRVENKRESEFFKEMNDKVEKIIFGENNFIYSMQCDDLKDFLNEKLKKDKNFMIIK
jgi:amino acid adenylation domain-containing protein